MRSSEYSRSGQLGTSPGAHTLDGFNFAESLAMLNFDTTRRWAESSPINKIVLLCIGQFKASTCPPPPAPAYLGLLTPLPSRGGRNLIIRVFQGVGNLNCTSISCKIFGVASYHGGRGVRAFSWKRLCLCGQLVTRKGLKQAFRPLWSIQILKFSILDSGFECMNVFYCCVYNEIEYLYRGFNTTT